MKIIEALKQLKIIEDRIKRNTQKINTYAAYISTEGPAFSSHEEQVKEVAGLLQSVADLGKEYLRLKTAIAQTNLVTQVSVGDRTFSIAELIILGQHGVGNWQSDAFVALETQKAATMLRGTPNTDPQNPPRIIPAYNQKQRNEALEDWLQFLESISGRLEVVNAETDLVS
jgi:hypothetical protein